MDGPAVEQPNTRTPARHPANAGFRALRILALLGLLTLLFWSSYGMAAGRVQEFLPKAQPSEFFPGADRYGPAQGDPPLVPAYQGDRLLGYVYLNSDVTERGGLFRQADQPPGRHRPAGRHPRHQARRPQGADRPRRHSRAPHRRRGEHARRQGHEVGGDRGRASAAGRHRQRRHRDGARDGRQRRALGRAADPQRPPRRRQAPAAAAAAPASVKTLDLDKERDPRLADPPRRRLGPSAVADRRRGQRGLRQGRQPGGCRQPGTERSDRHRSSTSISRR